MNFYKNLSVTIDKDDVVADGLRRKLWCLSWRLVEFGLLLNLIFGYKVLEQGLGLVLNVLALIMNPLSAVDRFDFRNQIRSYLRVHLDVRIFESPDRVEIVFMMPDAEKFSRRLTVDCCLVLVSVYLTSDWWYPSELSIYITTENDCGLLLDF